MKPKQSTGIGYGEGSSKDVTGLGTLVRASPYRAGALTCATFEQPLKVAGTEKSLNLVRSAVTKIQSIIILIILVVAAAAGGLYYYDSTLGAAPSKLSLSTVTFASSTTPAGALAYPAIVAEQSGYYAKYGLTVNFIATSGSAAVLSDLTAGQAQIGDMDSLFGVTAKANGSNIRMIFMTFPREPDAIYCLGSAGVQTPQDLPGKSIGISFGSSSYATFPAFAKVSGFDASKVKLVNLGFTSQLPSLITGKVDCYDSFLTQYYDTLAAVQNASKTLTTIRWGDYLTRYGSAVTTTDSFIQAHEDVVKVLVAGYSYGLSYILAHQDDSATMVTKQLNGVDMSAALNRVKTFTSLQMSAPLGSGQPYGYMNDTVWSATIQIAVNYLGVKPSAVNPSQMYTVKYLPTS